MPIHISEGNLLYLSTDSMLISSWMHTEITLINYLAQPSEYTKLTITVLLKPKIQSLVVVGNRGKIDV